MRPTTPHDCQSGVYSQRTVRAPCTAKPGTVCAGGHLVAHAGRRCSLSAQHRAALGAALGVAPGQPSAGQRR